jgi:hypothetical protein
VERYLEADKADVLAIRQAVAPIIQEHPSVAIVGALEFIRQKEQRTLAEAEALDAFEHISLEPSGHKRYHILMAALIADDQELIFQLLDDVEILEAQFAVGIPKPPATRAIFAPILRRWIVEGLFFKAQKLILPAQASFMTSDNSQAIKLCETGMYEHWMGLIWFGTKGIAVCQRHGAIDGNEGTSLGSGTNATPQKASIFFDQKMLFWKSNFYTRAQVIKMHANALGGVHFGFPSNEAYIYEIKNYFGFELRGGQTQMLRGDEIENGRTDPQRRGWIYDATELIAMDTARIFASGIRTMEKTFLALLA